MKILIIVSIIFQLSTALLADNSFNQYLKMKKETYSLYEDGDQKGAITHVKHFIEKYPKNVNAQNLLAVLYYWSGDLSKSKELLYAVLEQEQFPQAKELLQRVLKAQKTTEKVQKKNSSTFDLDFLLQKIKNDSFDIISRKILAKHFDNIGDKKQSQYFANEVLKIDPDDKEMLSFLKIKDSKSSNSKEIIKKSFKKLDDFYAHKQYNQFINLYNSLENNNIVMSTKIHIDALYCAIELKQYKKAKLILNIYKMPRNKYIQEIENLVDEKLLNQRFAVLED